MRNAIRHIVFCITILLLTNVNVYSEEFQYCETLLTAWSNIFSTPNMTQAQSSDYCLQKAVEYQGTITNGTECSAASQSMEDNPSVCFATVCCPESTVFDMSNLQSIKGSKMTITGIPVGTEKTAVDSVAENYWNNTSLEQYSGKVPTDSGKGLSYICVLGDGTNESTCHVVAWRRGVQTSLGENPIPLTDISGSGGGGLTNADVEAAVQAGTGEAHITHLVGPLGDIYTNISETNSKLGDTNSKLDTLDTGLGDVETAVGNVAGSVGSVRTAVEDVGTKITDLKNSLQGEYVGNTDNFNTPWSPDIEGVKDFGESFSEFMSDMQQSSFVNAGTSFFNDANNLPSTGVRLLCMEVLHSAIILLIFSPLRLT